MQQGDDSMHTNAQFSSLGPERSGHSISVCRQKIKGQGGKEKGRETVTE
jgi:hypothetical protein